MDGPVFILIPATLHLFLSVVLLFKFKVQNNTLVGMREEATEEEKDDLLCSVLHHGFKVP